jgi:transposase
MDGNTGRWVGIDVSKGKLDVALLDERGKVKSHVFANDAKGHATLVGWLRERSADLMPRVCMESTGHYGEAAATALVDAGYRVSVVNPARVKGFAQSELARNKTDRADAALLARFGLALQPEAWTAPPQEVRVLRSLVERLHSLKEMHQQEANRLEAATQCGLRESIRSHMQWLQGEIKALERQINDHIDGHPGLRTDVDLITSIPGLGNTTAAKLLAYLGDVRRFRNAKALAAFVGVTPQLRLSGSSVRGRSSISRSGHAVVRHAMYMPALVALKHNPLVSAFGIRLKTAGLAPKAVIAACMHKLVMLVYGIIKSRKPFDPHFGFNRLDIQDGI